MKHEKNFVWDGIDSQGFKTKGQLTAYNIQEVQLNLKQQKITPLKIKQQVTLKLFLSQHKIRDVDITEFSIELATLISAGIPLVNALSIISDSTNKAVMKKMLGGIIKQIEDGLLLSAAMQRYENHFGKFFCNLVTVGEHAGMLDSVLKHLAIHREKMAALKQKVKKTLFYPGIVLVVALGVACAMLIFVLPQFEQLFQGVGAELPWLTKMLIQNAQLLRTYGGALFLSIATLCFFIRIAVRRFKSWQHFLEQFCLKLPIIGKILTEAIFARCFRTLATTLQAGLPLLEALQLSANIADNHLYKLAFIDICQQVRNGKTLCFSFQSTQKFSERSIQMIRIGEESGP